MMDEFGKPPQLGAPDARERVKMPAIGLMVTAGVGVVFGIFALILNIVGGGLGALGGGGAEDQIKNLFSGAAGIVSSIIGLAMAGFLFYCAKQMQELKNHGLAVAASVIAMIPCISPCCLLGIPAGIWALVVLMDANVKAAFASN